MALINGHSDFSTAKSSFLSGRAKSSTKIIIKQHCIIDHPQRKFTAFEIKQLIKEGNGEVEKNERPTAIPGSILFKCKDADNDDCEFAILIHYDKQTGNIFLVVHAFRKDK